MNAISILAALALAAQSGLPKDVLDTPIGKYSKGPKTVLDRMTLGDMMRLLALPEARLREARCAGLAQWNARTGQGLDPSKLARFRAAVASSIAHDAELAPDLAAGFVDAFGEQLDEREKGVSKRQHAEAMARKQADCAPLLAMAAADAPLTLHPLNNASVVSPALATCHALYTVAAEEAVGEEADDLRKQAARATELALAGKDLAGQKAAREALEAEVAAARKNPVEKGEREMMRLVTCLPLLSEAEKGSKE